jgi:hypothetical protein
MSLKRSKCNVQCTLVIHPVHSNHKLVFCRTQNLLYHLLIRWITDLNLVKYFLMVHITSVQRLKVGLNHLTTRKVT